MLAHAALSRSGSLVLGATEATEPYPEIKAQSSCAFYSGRGTVTSNTEPEPPYDLPIISLGSLKVKCERQQRALQTGHGGPAHTGMLAVGQISEFKASLV